MNKKINNKLPFLRFKNFNDLKWDEKTIKNILNYEQPNKYIIKSEINLNCKETPVLTAGKSFVLGYTNEKKGIYDKGEVIIFDDFTTDFRYINFPFKIKSSAIKLLTTKKEDLFFVFNALKNKKINSLGHNRHYISFFQNIKVNIPELKEQQKIATFFSLLDKQIELWEKKLSFLEQMYKYINNKILICDIFKSKFTLKDLCYIPKKESIHNYENFKKMTLKLHNQGIILLNENPKKTKKGRPYFIRNAGELLIGKQNIHNRSFYIIPNIDNIYVTSNALMSLLPKNNFNLKQIYYLMRTNRWIHYVDSLNSATGQKEYSEKQILNFLLPYDNKNNKIVDVLDRINDLKNKITNYIHYLNQKKIWFLNSMFL